MKAIIPAAGQGTRLYPQTHTKPKAMVRLAGRPILGHILSNMVGTTIEQVVIVVGGPMKTQITEYAEDEFGDEFDLTFIEQQNAEGLGHSIYQAEKELKGHPVLIALGDMLFKNGYGTFLEAHGSYGQIDGCVGVKQVDEPSHYGVAEIDDGGRVSTLVEKPEEPPSDYAISGVYIVEDTNGLFDALTHILENDLRGAGDEYQLTDALQRMIEEGADLRTFEVEDWYDCGRPETLLEANRVLLSQSGPTDKWGTNSSVVIPPVDIGDDVTIDSSVVGPNVSIDDGAHITESLVEESIIGREADLVGVNIAESIIGSNASVKGEANHLNVGDNSSVNL